MKTKTSRILSFLALLALCLPLSSFLVQVPQVLAANTATETCKNEFPRDQSACEKGYNGGYSQKTLEEACGSQSNPVDGITYGGPTASYSACAGGHSFGVAQRKKDGVPDSKPTGESLNQRAKLACKGEYGESGDRAEACQRGYKAANASGATSKSVTDECNKGNNEQLKTACRRGVDLADKDNVQVNVPTGGAGAAVGIKNQNDKPDDQVDCDTKLSSVLSWIACPLIDMGVMMTDKVFANFIQPMLENVPVSTNPEDGSFKAWQQFRIIANVLLVGTLLAIVYSQAKGGGGGR